MKKEKNMNKRILVVNVFLFIVAAAGAQSLNYDTYIDLIQKQNAAYMAEKLHADIGKEEIKAAHAVDDPSLSFEYGNNSDRSIAMGQSFSAEISKPLSPGKRASRIAVADQQCVVSQTVFDDYWRNLKADATLDFYQALLVKELLQIDSQACRYMETLASSDSLRFVKGEISALDMQQTRLELQRAQLELNGRHADYVNALRQLDERCGNPFMGTRHVEGRLEIPSRYYELQQLLDQALHNRPDLRAAEESVVLVQLEEKLALRERRPDVELVFGAGYNTRVRNEEAPAPEFMGYSVGLTVPLPVLSVNPGVRRAGVLRQQQARLQSESVRNSIQGELSRMYNTYQAALRKAKAYGEVLVGNAQQVLEGKRYAYQRGETSLLEVLAAQHAFNEIQGAYANCIYDCMAALVELERSAGL